GICHRYNQSGVPALEDPRVSPAAARSAREMLAADGTGRGFVLATSPVVGIAADALSARVFVSATFLAPRGADRIEHRRGSLLVSFTRAPVELRVRNEPAVDPESGERFSSRHLVECLRRGA
ncbi:hypothetical protein, partial [Microbacterium sp. B19]|uniref:hypothetical protein n=1 Tax=Microbacterium sp. B19 TaxID=96765 RepID=UPI00056C7D63